jgi:predicted CoA-binding protein
MKSGCEIPLYKADDSEIQKILTSVKTIAIVGMSRKQERDSYRVGEYLKQQGYKIIPVNPGFNEILGEKCYPALDSIPEKVDLVDIFRKPEAVPEIVDLAIKIGAKVVWMQIGVVNNLAAERARAAGLLVVMNRCIMVEHKRFFSKLTNHQE